MKSNLESERVTLDRCIPGTDCLGDLGHSLVLIEHLRVLQLVEVVHNPGVSLPAPNLGHQLLVVGGL